MAENPMQSRFFCLVALGFAFTWSFASAEVPPLSEEELEKQAALIVTGIVTDVNVSAPKARADGWEFTYDLTVEVAAVKKGQFNRGKRLVARGSYIKLKSGYVGGSGHHGITNIRPGWELLLHLA